ncbi:MAG: hypothetical protein QOI01_5208 [Mycobacterium sp.]|jgi:hypothetical protein|nr:hypothetical protein [Mycobacterium sp.]
MSYCHITRFDLMHVTETGPALRQTLPPGREHASSHASPHVITDWETDWEYGGIEYGGLSVTTAHGHGHLLNVVRDLAEAEMHACDVR